MCLFINFTYFLVAMRVASLINNIYQLPHRRSFSVRTRPTGYESPTHQNIQFTQTHSTRARTSPPKRPFTFRKVSNNIYICSALINVLTNAADTEAEGTLAARGSTLDATLVRVQADARPCSIVGQALVVNR